MLEIFKSNIRRTIRLTVVFILTILLIVFSPIIGLGILPFFIFRFVVIQYTKYFRSDLGKILSTRSGIFATDDLYRNPKANILVPLIQKGRHITEIFKNDFYNGAVNVRTPTGELVNPEFQQYVSFFMGLPFWKWDEFFNIDNHIKEYEGPTQVFTQEVLNEFSTEYLKKPWIPGRSPWEIIFFPECKLNPQDSDEPRTAVLFRCHHSFSDGFSIVKVIASVIPEQKIILAAPSAPKISGFRKMLLTIGFFVLAPFEFVNSLMESFDVNECHISQDKLCPSPLLAFERIPLDFVREIKRAHGTGLTAVLLAAFTGAVRYFMIENGYKIPAAIHSVIPFPMPGHSDKLRNFMTTCFIRLPIGLSTAEDRLLAIEKNIQKLKRSTQPITMFYILGLLGSLPSWLAKPFFQQNFPTTIISNFPGPQEEIIYLGRPLEDIMFTAGLLPGRIGIGFNAISYNGGLRIQAAFNEALAVKKLPRTFLLDKVLQELQTLAQKHNT